MSAPDDSELQPGQVLLGKFRVLARLGAGGVGAVFRVRHELTLHERALKVLHPRFRHHPEVVERFLREASAAGRIGNPHIVETFDAGFLETGAPYLVMELLDGASLSDVLRHRGRLSVDEACAVLIETCGAIQAAHEAGIVHRDLKPENLFVCERDRRPFLKVLDFGMSKFDPSATGALQMTVEGMTMGTPLYMAPEQMRGASSVDARADVYALGVILYEGLSGGVPYSADSFAELAQKVLSGGCPPLGTLRELPAGLSEVVASAMAVDPALRLPSAKALAEALTPFATSTPTARAWWRVDHTAEEALARSAQRATPGAGQGVASMGPTLARSPAIAVQSLAPGQPESRLSVPSTAPRAAPLQAPAPPPAPLGSSSAFVGALVPEPTAGGANTSASGTGSLAAPSLAPGPGAASTSTTSSSPPTVPPASAAPRNPLRFIGPIALVVVTASLGVYFATHPREGSDPAPAGTLKPSATAPSPLTPVVPPAPEPAVLSTDAGAPAAAVAPPPLPSPGEVDAGSPARDAGNRPRLPHRPMKKSSSELIEEL